MKRKILHLFAIAVLFAAAASSSYAENVLGSNSNTSTIKTEKKSITQLGTPSEQQAVDQAAKDKELQSVTASDQQGVDQASIDQEQKKRRIIQRLKRQKMIEQRKSKP